jgi:hypothetical protein
MHIKFGSIAKIITHGASNDVINKHYMDVMRIVAEINGQYLYKTLGNPTPVSYSK